MPDKPSLKKCFVCDKEFGQTEYYIHLQEEILKQLLSVNESLDDIFEVTQLTYNYMDQDTSNDRDTEIPEDDAESYIDGSTKDRNIDDNISGTYIVNGDILTDNSAGDSSKDISKSNKEFDVDRITINTSDKNENEVVITKGSIENVINPE